MFVRLFLFSLPLAFLVSLPCFADIVEVRTDEPADAYLGMKIDLRGRDFTKRITVDKDTFLLIDQNDTDIRIAKDPNTKLNHFNALIPYNLYRQGLKTTSTRFLYLQCPIVRTTYVDSTKPIITNATVDGNEFSVSFEGDRAILKEEFINVGFYKFLPLPNNSIPKLSINFPMEGKVSQHFDMVRMCEQTRIIYLMYRLDETNRSIVLEKYGLL